MNVTCNIASSVFLMKKYQFIFSINEKHQNNKDNWCSVNSCESGVIGESGNSGESSDYGKYGESCGSGVAHLKTRERLCQ